MYGRLSFLVFILALAIGCSQQSQTNLVRLHYRPATEEKVLLERVGSGEEKTIVVDSVETGPSRELIVFQLTEGEEAIYRIRIRNYPSRIYFINNQREIDIFADQDLRSYHFTPGSKNEELKTFMAEQLAIAMQVNQLAAKSDSLLAGTHEQSMLSQNASQLDSLRTILRNRDIAYTDTTSSPGAFLFVYNRVDFGRDYDGLKTYIQRAAERFPGHSGIRRLTDETLRYINIFEEEYEIGERLPSLSLPDKTGSMVPVADSQGRYLLIDFWSTWCPRCTEYAPGKARLSKEIPASKLKLISIAIDAEKETWQRIVTTNNLPGVHLIDEKMWRGTAVQAFKIDSIPFNFLISPDRIVLAKAIRKDSLVAVVKRLVK
ncbi:MAG: TlpA family protein disulfide reductase [Chitinophagaceae bacterium]|nr:TlpA family protein disulfide reductase [Chitinophagaceae bacterium]